MTANIVTIESLNAKIERTRECIRDRQRRIDECLIDDTDCFMSAMADRDAIDLYKRQIKIIEDGGTAWFTEYATLDNQLVNAKWCDTKYGYRLRAEMPNGEVVWTSARTANGLAKKGLKEVKVKRVAWSDFGKPLFPAKLNRATGEYTDGEPIEIRF